MRNVYFTLLIILGVASAFLLSQPVIYLALYYLLIGIIVNPFLMLIPFLFTMLLGGVLASYILPDRFSDDGKVFAGALMTLGLLITLSLVLNIKIDLDAKISTKSDTNRIEKGIKIKNLAVVTYNTRISKNDEGCDGNCIRALLNHQVEKYIIAPSLEDANAPAVGYYFEKRESCPAINYGKGYDERSDVTYALAQAAAGNCIISYPTNLKEADFVIEKLDSYTIDQKDIRRVSAFTQSDGKLDKVYQQSAVSYSRYGPVFGFVPDISGATSASTEIWKIRTKIGSIAQDDLRVEFKDLLTKKLGLNLELNTSDLDDALDASITKVIEGKVEPALAQQLINDYFSLSYRKDKEKDAVLQNLRVKLFIKALADKNYLIPLNANNIMNRKNDLSSETLQAIGNAIFTRLESYYDRDFRIDKMSDDERKQFDALDSIIYNLPPDVIKNHLADYKKIIKNPELRNQMDYSLRNISYFGDDGKELFFNVLEDIGTFAEDEKNKYYISEPVWESLSVAFCRLAKLGDIETKTKFEKYADYHISMHGEVSNLLSRHEGFRIGLVKMGMNEGELKALYRISEERIRESRHYFDFNEYTEKAQKNDCD